jgi:hypothetical protein
MKKGRHSDPDPERREGEESPHLPFAGSASKSAPAKSAEGPFHTSLRQRPRSKSTSDPKRAEGPTHRSRHKPRAAR